MKPLTVLLLCVVSPAALCMDIIDVANSIGATKFVHFLNVTGLTPAFTQNGQFTVFVPTNAAFDAVPAAVLASLAQEPASLRKLLMYHAVDGMSFSSQLTNEMELTSLDIEDSIRINVYKTPNTVVTASGSPVIRTDLNASNGVVHVISRVMYPMPTKSAVQYLASDTDLGTLLYSVSMTTVATELQAGGPFTIFAPNNAAFDRLPAGYWSDLFNQNYTAYVGMLRNHVVPGTLFSAGLTSGPVTTLTGQKLNIHLHGGSVMVNNAKVVTADQTVKNGVVHIIDNVLRPSS